MSVEVPLTRPESAELIRRMFRSGFAGFVGGGLVAGVGGRLAMRATSLIDRSAHGLRTENGFRVGEVTLGGTIELMVFIGIFGGLVVASTWVVVERWLPTTRGARMAAAAVAAVGFGGRLAIDGTNFDFRILDPSWLMALVFIVTAAITGPVVVGFEAVFDRRLSHGDHWARLWVGLAILGVVPALAVFATLLDSDCSCLHRPVISGGLLVGLGVFTVVTWIREFRGARLSVRWRRSGVGLLWLAVVAGLVHLAREIAHFT